MTNLESLFAFPFNTTDNDASGPELKPVKRSVIGELLAKLDKDNEILEMQEGRFDIQEFNAINAELKNLTRFEIKDGYRRYHYDRADYYYPHVSERKKKMMFLNANLQFLIHTRYKVAIAIKLRNIVKFDKRYKLGYLFARVRRLLTAQRKMVAAGQGNRATKLTHNLYTLMRLYEKVTRLDVDIRDTCTLIRRVYGERAVVDRLY